MLTQSDGQASKIDLVVKKLSQYRLKISLVPPRFAVGTVCALRMLYGGVSRPKKGEWR